MAADDWLGADDPNLALYVCYHVPNKKTTGKILRSPQMFPELVPGSAISINLGLNYRLFPSGIQNLRNMNIGFLGVDRRGKGEERSHQPLNNPNVGFLEQEITTVRFHKRVETRDHNGSIPHVCSNSVMRPRRCSKLLGILLMDSIINKSRVDGRVEIQGGRDKQNFFCDASAPSSALRSAAGWNSTGGDLASWNTRHPSPAARCIAELGGDVVSAEKRFWKGRRTPYLSRRRRVVLEE